MKEDRLHKDCLKKIQRLERENQALKDKLRFHEIYNEFSNHFDIFRDKDHKVCYISPNFERLTGYLVSDYIQEKIRFRDLVHEEEKKLLDTFFHQSVYDNIPANHTFKTVHKDGTIRYLSVSTQSIYDENGEYTGHRASCIDVTQHKEAELAQKESEYKIRVLNEMSTEMLNLKNLADLYQYVANSLHKFYPKCIILYISIDEVQKDTRFEAVAGLDNGLLNSILQISGFNPIGKHYKLVPRHNDYFRTGKFVEFQGGLSEFSATEFPSMAARAIEMLVGLRKIYTIGIVKDEALLAAVHFLSFDKREIKDHLFIEAFIRQVGVVMQKLLAEQELKESEEKYRLLFENISYGFQLCEMVYENEEPIDFRFLETNKYFEDFSGLSNIKGKTVKEVLPNADINMIKKYGAVAANGKPFTIEYRSNTFNKYVRVHAYCPQTGQFAAIYEDITERKKTEAALELSEKNHTQFFNTLKDIIWILNEKGEITYANNYAITRLGYSLDEIIGRSVVAMHPTERKAEAMAVLDGIIIGELECCQIPLVAKSGEYISVETDTVKGVWNGAPAIYAICKDISIIKLSEEKFSKAFHNNASIMGISLVDTGEYIEVNKAFLKTFDLTKEEVIGKTSIELGIFTPEMRKDVMERYTKEGKIQNLEFSLSYKDRQIEGLMSGDLIFVQNKKCWLVVMQDISEIKKAEKLVNETLNLQEILINNISAGIIIVDCETRNIEVVNETACSLFGTTEDKIKGYLCRNFLCVHETGDCPFALLHSEHENTEEEILRKDGTKIPILKTVKRLNIAGRDKYIETFIDISELKKTQYKLAISEEKFEQVINNSFDTLVLLDADGIQRYVSSSCKKILGYDVEELTNISVLETMIHPLDVQSTYEAFISIIKNGTGSARYRHKHKDGGWVYLEGYGSNQLNNPALKSVIINVRNITEKVKAEQALMASEEKLKAILSLTPAIISVVEPNGKITYNSPYSNHILGYNYDLTGFNILENRLLHPDDVEKVSNSFQALLKTPDGKTCVEYRCLSKDKGYVWLEATGKNYMNTKSISGVLLFIHDITERKRAELALAESETRLRMVIDSAKEGTWDWDIETGYVKFNEYWAEILNCELSELASNVYTWDKVIHPDDMPTVMQSMINHLKGKTDSFKTEHRVKTKTGEWKWVLTHGKVIAFDEMNRPLRAIGTHVDIDELKKTQENLQQLNEQLKELNATKDKFFSIIAHDLKNPFAVLLSSCELLTMHLNSNNIEKAKAKAEMIFSSSKHGHNLLQNLLDWAQSQIGNIKFNPSKINLWSFTEECLHVIQDQARNKNIKIENTVDKTIDLRADGNILQVVIRNLVTNAIKFTANSGLITISATRCPDFVEISIKDKGIGMLEETIDKLFRIDSKISTKGTNEETGTGLGLILCKEFIEKHGGKIWAESIYGEGSTFKFTLPSKI